MRFVRIRQSVVSQVLVILTCIEAALLCGGCPSDGGDGGGLPGGVVTLTVTVTPPGAGTLTLSPQRDSYMVGDTVSITATAGNGYQFDRFEGDVSGTGNPLVVTLAGNTSVNAVFVQTGTVRPEVSERAKVLTDEIALTVTGANQVRLTGAGIPLLTPGDVIVHAATGTIARVKSVSAVNGATLLQTAPASLTDIIRRAHIELNTAKLQTQARPVRVADKLNTRMLGFDIEDGAVVLDLSGADIDLEDKATVSLTNGTFRFAPTFDLVLDIDDFRVQRFKLVATGTAQLNLDVDVAISRVSDWIEKEITLAETEFLRGVVMAGPIPIEYVFFVKLKLGAAASFGDIGTISGGFDMSASLSAGAEYVAGGWSPVGAFHFDVNPHLPGMTVHPVEVQVYAKPEFGVKFYEIVGPSISFKDYAKLVSDYRHDRIGAELVKGSEVSLNFDLSVPRIDAASLSYSKVLFDESYVMLARLAFATDPAGLGTLSWSPQGWLGSDLFWYIDPVTVTGTPGAGCRVAGYGIDYLCQDRSLTKSGDDVLRNEPIDGSKLITAYFVPLADGDDWVGSGNTTTPGPYVVNTQVFPPEAGSVVLFPRRSGYKSGDKLLVEARPEYGFRFHHWENALEGTAPVERLTVWGNKTVRAVFESVVPRLLKVPQDYGTIQAAINAATYGDQIILNYGTYSGDGNRDLDFQGKHLTITGQSAESTIIDLGGSATTPHRFAELCDVKGQVNLANLTIRNGYAGNAVRCNTPNYVGGAIRVMGSASLFAAHCVFENCRATGGGGAIWYGAPLSGFSPVLHIWGCRFTDCSSDDGGGAICAQNPASYIDSTVKIEDSTFTGNAGKYGGAVYSPELYGAITITGCQFSSNRGSQTGGAVYVARTSDTAIISNCAFTANTCTSAAGALYCEGNVLGNGGVIHVTNCTFSGNTAKNHGAVSTGPLSYERERVNVEGCQFTGNSSTADNGALYLAAGTVMRNCTFASNTSASDAGAATIRGLAADCVFTGNTAAKNAGAVVLDPGGLLSNSSFTGNTAGMWGGAVWISYASVPAEAGTISACSFVSNSAKGAGAIKAQGGTIRNCTTVSDNLATYYGGGAISARLSEITNCVISGNRAPQAEGGGLVSNECFVSQCTITGNAAGGNGGGVYDHDSTIVHCSITDNSATNAGGVWCSDTQLGNNTIEYNSPNNCASGGDDSCCGG